MQDPASPLSLHERDDLLARLSALERQARRGQARIVLVCGEAGAGKSALVDAFTVRTRNRWGSESVQRGACDAVAPSRPFAPLIDIAGSLGGPIAAALAAKDRVATIDAFLDLLRRPIRTRVVVLEDLHWADAPTLELLRVVGRRFRELRVLVVGTYRDDEVDETHRLRLALGDLPAPSIVELQVPRLSLAAVRAMVRGTTADPAALHRATGGNAFFVTELLDGGGFTVPTTVRDAVLIRASRLSGSAQGALRAASMLEPRFEPDLLHEVALCDEGTVSECLSRGVLERDVESNALGFRHELAREAISSTVSESERRTLHARALEVLSEWTATADVDPSRLAEHAIGAGDSDAVLRFAPVAAEKAAALGAHREAAMHYEAALDVATALDPERRGELLEGHARESRLADRVADALTSQAAAVDCWRSVGNARREGDALQALSSLYWFSADADRAQSMVAEAVALLEPVMPHGPELARAYATLAQRYATSAIDDDAGRHAASAAIGLAEQLSDERIAVHALTSQGVMEAYADLDRGVPLLERAAARAEAADLGEEAARALINLVEAGRAMRRFDIAERHRAAAGRSVEVNHLEILRRRLVSVEAELSLEMGRWADADELSASLIDERTTAPIIRAKALIVLGHLYARRGDRDPWPLLDEAIELIGDRGEGQDLSPARVARAEAAWLDGDLSRAADEAARGVVETLPFDRGWFLGEIAWWAKVTDPGFRSPVTLPQPFRVLFDGRYSEAAACWEAIGAPYHRARALAGSDDEADVRKALTILHALGARRHAAGVRRHLRSMGGTSVPRGPHRLTDANPGRLTNRQLEVLSLVSEGLTNAQIAKRLVLSAKTVDHHVSAILGKLGVSRRAEAAERARVILSSGALSPSAPGTGIAEK